MSESTDDATVLVVDDEKEVADVYALRLRHEFETQTAYDGEAALEAVGEDSDVDVVLLDRRMPGVSGDEVLESIKTRDPDCRVIMITAVDPDFDIIDMPFDDYLCKPIEKDDLVAAINQQLAARRYDDQLARYLEATSKLALLEAEKSGQRLDENEDVAAMKARVEALRAEMDDTLGEFEDIEQVFTEIRRHPG